MSVIELVRQDFAFGGRPGYVAAVADGSAWPVSTVERLAAWEVVVGDLNQGILLRRAGKAPGFRAPARASMIVREQIEVLEPLKEFLPHDSWAGLCELRIYTLRTGCGEEYAGRLLSVLPLRERFSRNAGIWQTRSGDVERILHIWPYVDVAERYETRERLSADAEWQDFVRSVTPFLARMSAMFVRPIALP